MNILDKLFQGGQQRQDSLRNFAYARELDFYENFDESLIKQLQHFKLFNIGGRKKIKSCIHYKDLNWENYLFDFQYTISTGKSSHTYKQSIFFVNSGELTLPEFYQKPENFLTKLMAYIGYDDIDFDQNPEYSDLHHLKGKFESVVRFFFSPEILSLLSNQKELYMEGMNHYFILYVKHKLIPVEKMHNFRELGLMLYNLFRERSQESTKFLKLNS